MSKVLELDIKEKMQHQKFRTSATMNPVLNIQSIMVAGKLTFCLVFTTKWLFKFQHLINL